MRISASEFILFTNNPVDNYIKLSQHVSEIEIMMDGDAWDHGEQGWTRHVEEIKKFNTPFTVHPPAWDVNVSAPLGALRDAASWLNLKSVEFAHEIGASQVVYHPGYYDRDSNFSKTRAIDFAYKTLDKMISAAKPYGIQIAFENIGSPGSSLFTQQEYVHALDGIDESVRYLIDVGHANLNNWDIAQTIEQTGDRLCAFHMHDNDGKSDQHLPICTGKIKWKKVFDAMKELPDDILYVLEYATNTPLYTLDEGVAILNEKLKK